LFGKVFVFWFILEYPKDGYLTHLDFLCWCWGIISSHEALGNPPFCVCGGGVDFPCVLYYLFMIRVPEWRDSFFFFLRWTFYVAQVGLEVKIFPVSASQLMGLDM
jgi:hypothetical protein